MYSSHSIVYHITAEFYQTLNTNRITMTNFLNLNKHGIFWELPWWCSGKESACQCRRCKRQGFNLWVGNIPWRRKWQPMPVFLPGKSHGQPMVWKNVRHNLATKQQKLGVLWGPTHIYPLLGNIPKRSYAFLYHYTYYKLQKIHVHLSICSLKL